MVDVQRYLDDLADEFLAVHQKKERLFWKTKMGTSDEFAAYEQAEVAARRFVGDADRLAELRLLSERTDLTDAQRDVADGWVEMFSRNAIEGDRAQDLEKSMIEAEGEIERRRTSMPLGYTDPVGGEFVSASSAVLGNMVRADEDEVRRKAAWEGLKSIETFVLDHGFCDIVRQRNALARELGRCDYYEYKVQKDEGFSKTRLFELLDDLVSRTTDAARIEFATLADRDGIDGTLPWNYAYLTSGSLAAEKEPYFRFEDALERWGRSFAAMGIRYRNAALTVDLVDRPGKYENGFMHGPTPAFMRRGQWLPAEINFTANAVPHQVGAGQNAMVTLFHEGGHAAHFANVVTDAPCFSQEFAPTSTAFAETQSMLLDSLLSDADWQSRYAIDGNGNGMPFGLIERDLRQRQPSLASGVRRMLAVSYFEKALYELADEDVTPARVLELARDVERELLFFQLGSPRPVLSIPHLLSNDSSAYYHGYVLATVALEQTKAHFLRVHGHIVDNPSIGRDLTEKYWEPGNAVGFFEYVESLTGSPLSADALGEVVSRTPDQAVQDAREAVARLADVPRFERPIDLDCRFSAVHGHEQIVSPEMDFEVGAETFRAWVRKQGSAS